MSVITITAYDTKANRKKQAIARQAEYDLLSTDEKIARLDARLGAGVGAKRERARLAK